MEILQASFQWLQGGEVLGLKRDSIDLENRLLRKNHMKVTPDRDDTGKETIFIREKMKTKKVKERNLILPESLTQYLQNLKADQENRKKNLGDHYNWNLKDLYVWTILEDFIILEQTGITIEIPEAVSLRF